MLNKHSELSPSVNAVLRETIRVSEQRRLAFCSGGLPTPAIWYLYSQIAI
jgi:hypothetical protein